MSNENSASIVRHPALRPARSHAVDPEIAAEFDFMLDGLHELLVYKVRQDHDGQCTVLWTSPSIEGVIGLTRDEAMGDFGLWRDLIDAGDYARILEAETRALQSGERERLEVQATARGEHRPFMMTFKPSALPDGAVLWDGTMREITRERTAESERDRLAEMIEATDDFAGIAEPDGSVHYINPGARRLLKMPADFDEKQVSIQKFHPPETVRRFKKHIFPAVASEGSWMGEVEIQDFEGGVRPASAVVTVHRGPDGTPTHFSTIMRDLSERVAMETELRLVNPELNHRVKNLFSVMQALLAMSARGETDAKVLAKKLKSRMAALSAAHLMSTETDMGGAALKPVPLDALLHSILEPYERGESHLSMSGPRVELQPNALTPVGLIVHELATNAIKYGAWSEDHGSIAVEWTAEDDAEPDHRRVRLHWLETLAKGSDDGDPELDVPDGPHMGSGFGSRLMTSSAAQLGGQVEQNWSDGTLDTLITFSVPHAARGTTA